MNGDKRDSLDERQLSASKQPENLCSSPFIGESEFPLSLPYISKNWDAEYADGRGFFAFLRVFGVLRDPRPIWFFVR